MLSGIRRVSKTDAILWPDVENRHGGHRDTRVVSADWIVPIASVHSLMAFPGDLAYPVAKAGLVGFIRSVATDYAPTIRCNAVAPGTIDSPALNDAPPEVRRRVEEPAWFNRVEPFTKWRERRYFSCLRPVPS